MHKLFSLTSAKFKRAICLFLVMANIFCSYGVLLAEEIGDTSETTLTEETSQETEGSENPAAADTGVQPSVTPVPTPTAIPGAGNPDEDITPSGKTVLNSFGSGYTVNVSYGPETGIPADAELVVTEIPAGDVYDEYIDKASGVLDIDNVSYARLFDISLISNGVEIEPAAGTSVAVRIVLNDAKDRNLNVVHMPEGSDAEVVDASCSKSGMGTELAFNADGFSAYAIVEGPESGVAGWSKLDSFDALDANASSGIVIGHGHGFYFTNTEYYPESGRTGVKKTKPESSVPVEGVAVNYFFEKVPGTNNQYYIYCEDPDGNIKYLRRENKSLKLVDSSQRTAFTAAYSGGKWTFVSGGYYINEQGKAAGNGFCTYNANDDGSKLDLWVKKSDVEDPYELNGKSYGLMFYNSGTAGKALMSDSEVSGTGSLDAMSMTVMAKKTDHGDKLFVSSDSDVSMWTFTWVSGEDYYLTTTVDGQTKYLSVTASGLTIVDTPATVSITAGSGENAGKIRITGNGSAVYYSGDVGTGFTSTGLMKNSWLNLVEM